MIVKLFVNHGNHTLITFHKVNQDLDSLVRELVKTYGRNRVKLQHTSEMFSND